jgi:5,5'-dehydrodivanillate O-demethylase oxygenase subunit
MLSTELNERLTNVGPGTPMGELLRRYWMPIAALSDLEKKPTMKVRLLGEDLALFRDRSGELGLVAELCPHRRCSLAFGIPENEGIRCPYHGWLFDSAGNCLEQPGESPNSTFKDRIKTPAYRVEVKGGLIWGYMGPAPAPLLPNWEYLVRENTYRAAGRVNLPCNWLAPMENSMDPVHLEWLHFYYTDYVQELHRNAGVDAGSRTPRESAPVRRHKKIGFDVFDYGLIKRRVYEGGSEEDTEWKDGHPLVFPNWLSVGNAQIRVPVDDENTQIWFYQDWAFPSHVTVPEQESIPVYDISLYDENGDWIIDTVEGQDMMAWVTQGVIADRAEEHVGSSDRGILLYRKLLQEEMLKVEQGIDPLAVIRDPSENVCITLPMEQHVLSASTPEEARRLTSRAGFSQAPQELKDFVWQLTMEAYGISAA